MKFTFSSYFIQNDVAKIKFYAVAIFVKIIRNVVARKKRMSGCINPLHYLKIS